MKMHSDNSEQIEIHRRRNKDNIQIGRQCPRRQTDKQKKIDRYEYNQKLINVQRQKDRQKRRKAITQTCKDRKQKREGENTKTGEKRIKSTNRQTVKQTDIQIDKRRRLKM
jgi:hypothetical protein